MPRRLRVLSALLLAGTAAMALAPPARADAGTDARIQALQDQVNALNAQLQDLKRSQSAQYDDAQRQAVEVQKAVAEAQAETAAQAKARKSGVKVSLDNGRPTIASADGRFSASIRALVQFDSGYFMQSHHALSLPAGQDLSSGSNFRRAQFGIQGRLFGDWAYFFNYDFGSSKGNEQQGRIQSAYIEYDGLGPLALRIGAYPPPAGLEDGTSSADTIFLERNSPSDVARNIAGGDGRDAASILYAGDRLFGALSYTGGKVADSNAYFDEQQALLGRLSGVVLSGDEGKLVLSTSGTWVFKAPDATAGPSSARNISLSDPPELTFDDNGVTLVSTGSLNTQTLTQWGVEAGGNWRNLYGQAGYFGYDVSRRQSALPDLSFSGWYAQASWVITGESRGYSAASGAFTSPKPAGEWGAWELAARYSDLDLNDRAGSPGLATPPGGIRGGEQRIWTLGLNWYPNAALKFMLDYENIDVDKLSATGADIGQKIQAVAIRSQVNL
ncbi:MAG TPA: porin [Rhizomicrobium sp.]|nr:porin [Rhizomicrobium sp.]